jgi:hypothetical protein
MPQVPTDVFIEACKQVVKANESSCHRTAKAPCTCARS